MARKGFRLIWLLAVIVGLATAQLTLAQGTTATIRGNVKDEGGNPFPTAEIVATNTASGFRNAATAGADGTFLMPGITPGTYRIDVTAPSYKGATKEITVRVGQTLDVDFRLTPDLVLVESITVMGATAVELRTPEVATNVTPQQIESLPQNDRNFLNFAALAPGVSLNTDEFRKEVRAGAQGASATNIYIDGVSFKNDVVQGGSVGQDASRGNPFPQNAVQEFRVITQNYSAQYAKASSAIITAVTKSGSNTLDGDAFIFYQDKGLVEEDQFRPGFKPAYERKQWGLSLGGPIVRDRMHFFFSYEANDQDRENAVTLGGNFQNATALRQSLQQYVGTFVSPFRSDLAFAKLSYQPTQSQLIDASATYRAETDVRNFGDQTSFETAEDVKNNVWGLTGRHQFTASTWFNEFSLSYLDSQFNPQPTNPNLVSLEYEGLLRIGGRDTEQKIGQERLSFRDDVTFSSLKLGSGSHTVKVGGTVDFLNYTVTKFFEENPHFFFAPEFGTAIPYRARFGMGDPDLSADNREFGIYGQDDWRLNDQLTLNLGLRWDYETNMLDTDYETPALIRQRLGNQFPSNYFTDGNDRKAPTDLWQPRLGFSYDVLKTGRTVLFGGLGRYYDRNLFNNTLDESFRLQHSVGEFFFSADGSPVRGQPAVKWDPKYLTRAGLQEVLASGITGKPEVFLVENDTKVPYSNQWNIGVRQSFGQMVGSVSYANIRSYNGFSYLWGAGFCCPQFDPAYSNVLISSDDVKTWYDAVYVQLDRPYSGRFGFNVAYTWADAEQVGGDLFSLDLPNISFWPKYGTPGSQDHKIVASGIVGIPWDVRLSSVLQYSSGDKFRIHDFSNGFCSNNQCYTPKTGEGPSWTTVDLRAEKTFPVMGRYSVGITAEAFNVFNEARYQNFQDFNPPEGNPNLGKPTSLVSGSQRRYQFGIRFGF
jgi:outer membrane receptor protein involved in Fe transport